MKESEKIDLCVKASVILDEIGYNSEGYNEIISYEIARLSAADRGLISYPPYVPTIRSDAEKHLERLEAIRDIYLSILQGRTI